MPPPPPSSSSPRGRGRNRVSRADRISAVGGGKECILDSGLFGEEELDESTTVHSEDGLMMDQTNINHDVGTNRFWRSVTSAVSRSLSPMRRHSGDNARARSESPPHRRVKRQDSCHTTETAVEEEEEEEEEEKTWQEERFELNERIEALETQLKTKEAVLKSMMKAAAHGNQRKFPTRSSMAPLAGMVLEKELELTQLEATVKQQLIRMEQFESQQQERVQRQAELLFQEWQQEEQQVSVWEQMQEQAEQIATLQAENEHQRQMYQRQQRRDAKLIQQLQDEKKQQQGNANGNDNRYYNINSNNNYGNSPKMPFIGNPLHRTTSC